VDKLVREIFYRFSSVNLLIFIVNKGIAYLGTKELEELLPGCIDQFKKERIDNVAYELCLGEEVYLTDSSYPLRQPRVA
jgi:hypothetical protein